MPWVRFGDASASYPKMMQVAGFPGAGPGAVNEVWGFVGRCAAQSGAHLTDYVVDVGTAHMIGGTRTKKLIEWCVRAGLFTPITVDGIQKWVLINDPEFIHIQTQEEVQWRRQRQRDNTNPALLVPVRLRDGDNCRYCGVLVHWSGPSKSGRSGQYDHRNAGEPATVETLVVACTTCNTSRKANPHWDADNPIRPAPRQPNYGKTTALFLQKNGYYEIQPNVEPDRTASSADAAPQRPEVSGALYIEERPTEDDAAGAHPAAAAAPSSSTDEPTGSGPPSWAGVSETVDDSDSLESALPGSGRDGTGRAGPGLGTGTRAGPGPGSTSSPARRRRRGNRGRKTNPTPTQHPGGETS